MISMSKRIKWIDTAKGIGLILVILGHLKIPFLSAWIYTFHMPLFFFLSGVVFTSGKYTFKDFLTKRIKSLVIPYFALGSIIFLFYVIVFIIQKQPTIEYLTMLREFLIQRHYWTIWFLAALFFTEILYYIIDSLLHNNHIYVTIVSILIAISGVIYYRLGGDGLPWNIDIALIAQLFFHFGYLFKKNLKMQDLLFNKSLLKQIGLILLLFTINFASAKLCIIFSGQSLDMSIGMYGNEILSFFSAIFGTLGICCICYLIHSTFLNWLGQNTMIIFSWHSRIGIVALDFLCLWLGWFQNGTYLSQAVRGIFYFSFLLVFFSFITILIKKSRYHKLFGV